MNRFKTAITIQGGASNPIAISRALVAAMDEVRDEYLGTDAILQDPAVRLIAHQLAHLLGVDQINHEQGVYTTLYAACEDKS